LRKTGRCEWGIFGPKGNAIAYKRCGSDRDDAVKWAETFMSTWPYIDIRIEDESDS
jgi:hypothetical protein